MTDYFKKIKDAVLKDKKTAGILGIILVIAFCLIFLSGREKEKIAPTMSSYSDGEYCAELEDKIKNIVTAITGDNDCIVAVTLETGSEYVYAAEQKTDTDREDGGEKTGAKESEKTENAYIIVKSKNGGEEPLVVTEKKPTIRGVAIVSSGVDSKKEAGILNAVCSVLGISSRKISITNKS